MELDMIGIGERIKTRRKEMKHAISPCALERFEESIESICGSRNLS